MAADLEGTFRDAACVLSTRSRLDGLAREVLTAPDLADGEVSRLVDFAMTGDLERGVAALERIRSAREDGAR